MHLQELTSASNMTYCELMGLFISYWIALFVVKML